MNELEQETVRLPSRSLSLEDAAKLTNVKELILERAGRAPDLDPLASPNLCESVEVLEIEVPEFSDLNLIRDYRQLKKLKLNVENVKDYHPLIDSRFTSTLSELHFYTDIDVPSDRLKPLISQELDFLGQYYGLRRLVIGNVNIQGSTFLRSKALAKGLKQVVLEDVLYDDSEWCFDYENLEEARFDLRLIDWNKLDDGMPITKCLRSLALSHYEFGARGDKRLPFADLRGLARLTNLDHLELNLDYVTTVCVPDTSLTSLNLRYEENINLEGFDQDVLCSSVQEMKIIGPRSRMIIGPDDWQADLDFMCYYNNLKTLELNTGEWFRDIIISKISKDSLVSLSLESCNEFRDLSMLQSHTCLQTLNLSGTNVMDIDCLLDFECVHNGSLASVQLPDTVVWTRVKNGKYCNTETIHRLRERNVEVILPETFPFGEEPMRFRPKLYIILGPSCAGKSTLIEYVKELGCKNLMKISDRNSRLDDNPDFIVRLPSAEFIRRADVGEIVAVHEFHKALFGVGYLELIEAKDSQDTYFLDSCDPFSALRLRDAYPDFVKLVLLDVPGETLEHRMHERELKEYKVGDIEKAAKNMRERRYALPEEYTKFRAFQKDMDYVIEDNPFKEMKSIISGVEDVE